LKKKILIGAIVLLLVTAIVVLICLFSSKKKIANSPEFVLSYAENQQEDYPTSQGALYFAKLVEERTEGRIMILVKTGGEMGTETDVLTQMKYGGVDFARVSISQLAAYAPELNVLQMPYLYNDSDHMWKVLDGQIGDDFLSGISDSDYVGLSWYDAGARSFYTAKGPIQKLEDLEGLTIRVQSSSLMYDMVDALGANPVSTDYAEVYSAIQRATVDGAENNWPSYESMKHYEVAPYFSEDEHTRVPEMQLCANHTWEKLSEEDRAIILECAKESAIYERQLWKERETNSRKLAIDNGAQAYSLSVEEKKRFQEAMSPVYEKYCSDRMDTINEIIAIGN